MAGYVMRYYNLHGDEISMEEWYALFDLSMDYRRVAKTQITDTIEVSTVWLGTDHSFGGGRPLTFETMVFRSGRGDEMWRWSTLAEALDGHELACAGVRDAEQART